MKRKTEESRRKLLFCTSQPASTMTIYSVQYAMPMLDDDDTPYPLSPLLLLLPPAVFRYMQLYSTDNLSTVQNCLHFHFTHHISPLFTHGFLNYYYGWDFWRSWALGRLYNHYPLFTVLLSVYLTYCYNFLVLIQTSHSLACRPCCCVLSLLSNQLQCDGNPED